MSNKIKALWCHQPLKKLWLSSKHLFILTLKFLASESVAGVASAGINSISFKNSLEGVVAGGDYEGDNATIAGQNFAFTNDGGKTWNKVAPENSPGTFLCCH